MATAELIFKITPHAGDFKATMAQVRSELTQTGQAQTTVAKSELSTRQQLAAAASLQRQRSAALIGEWKRTERAAADLARGVGPVKDNLQKVTDIMQTLGGASASLQGPLGGVAGRLRSLGALAGETGGSLGVVGVAAGALTVVAVGLGVALYKAATATAEFQGKMFDLSQQTGVSVETLSAFEILATTTGGSIDSITASLGIFQRNLEDAQVSTSKEARLLKELGVETNNTEQALRQTLTALAKMPEGFQQTSRALELFGRGGKSILAILKEMGGDLDGAIAKFRAMGILIDADTAKAADKFNDQLAVLQFQLRGLVALVGREAMPAILKAVESVSKALVDNQAVISAWARDIGDAGRGALLLGNQLLRLGGIITGLGNIPIPLILQILASPSGLPGIFQGLKKLGAGSPLLNMGVATGAASSVADLLSPPISGTRGGGKGKGGKTPRDTSLQDAIKEAEMTEREIAQKLAGDVADNKRALDEQIRDIEEFTQKAIELADQRLNATIDRINAEIAATDSALAKKLISQKEHALKSRELDLETKDAVQKNADEIWELTNKRNRQIATEELAAYQRSVKLADEASERIIASIKDRVNRELITEAEGERQIAVIEAHGFARKKEALEKELTYITTTLEQKRVINDELIALEGQRADAAVQASQRIVDALKREREEFDKRNEAAFGAERPRRVGDATRPRRVEGEEEHPFLTGLETGQLAELEEGVQSFQDVATVAFSAVGAAVNGLANGIGGLVENWVLMGSTGPNAMKKMVASVLAGVAAQSAVLAIFELAKGFAALFFNPAEAAAHFQAAALFGSLAFVTAVAGRAIAGDSFKSGSGGGGDSSGRESTQPARRSNEPIDINRRMGGAPNVTIQLHGDIASDALKVRVVNAIVESIDHNDTRITSMIQDAAKRGR